MGRTVAYLIGGLIAGLWLGYWLARRDAPARAPAEVCQHDAKVFRCVRYLGNYDGDTLRFQIPGVHPLIGENVSVRVSGIDTPEIKGKGRCESDRAKEARDLVASLLRNAKQIELRNVDRDKYFRINAEVIADGTSVGQTLLKKRLAYAYGGGTKERINWCLR